MWYWCVCLYTIYTTYTTKCQAPLDIKKAAIWRFSKSLTFIQLSKCREAKAPVGKGKYTVQNKIQEAVQQSCNIIIDLRRSKMLEEKAVKAYEREFYNSKGLRRMKIIKEDGELLDFCK